MDQYARSGRQSLGELVQKYWIRFLYGSNDAADPAVNVSVEDALPASLDFESESHSPTIDFTRTGQLLHWATAQTVSPLQTLDIQIDTRDSDYLAGSIYTNSATSNAGGTNIILSATTQSFTPLVTWPANGEICALLNHSLSVKGSAQPGTTIEVYEGDTLKGQSVTDAQGLFNVSYTGSQAGQATLNLRARACIGGMCSNFTQVSLTQSQSFWNHSARGGKPTWPGVRWLASMSPSNSVTRMVCSAAATGVSPVSSVSQIPPCISMSARGPTTGKMPTQIWVTYNGPLSIPISFSGNMYTYKIGSGPRVSIPGYLSAILPYLSRRILPFRHLSLAWPPGSGIPSAPAPVSIDPDGYVFNSTLGFDPQNPTQHVISGTRVTCMTFLPGWGGWVPWPAHLYDNQINPQVVGSNGYFAFFVPPGQYYLQAEGARWFSSLAQSGRGSGE